MEDDKTNIIREHSLQYAKGLLTVTGVTEVVRFEEREVFLNLGNRGMLVKGSHLRVAELTLKSALLRMEGEVESVSYTRAREKLGLAKRLFK